MNRVGGLSALLFCVALGVRPAHAETLWTVSLNGRYLTTPRPGLEAVEEDIAGTGWACVFKVALEDGKEIDIACSTDGLRTSVLFKKHCGDPSKLLLLTHGVGSRRVVQARLWLSCSEVQAPPSPSRKTWLEEVAQGIALDACKQVVSRPNIIPFSLNRRSGG